MTLPFLVSLSTSTLMTVGLLLVGCAIVVLFAWRNAQPTGSMGQLLHDTEEAPKPVVKR